MSARVVVLKFGSSLIRSPTDLRIVVQEIYRHLRRGRGVVAVVSAQAGATDALLAAARQVARHPRERDLAALLATGERASAALLALALDDAGLPAELLDPASAGFRAAGPALEAEPAGLDVQLIESHLSCGRVVVMPGFFARDEGGREVLLGRGGSDLTAVYLAASLGAECRLLKDVDGVYDADPAGGPGGAVVARRYRRLGWREAAALGARVVQDRALALAAGRRLELQVGAPGTRSRTRIGAGRAVHAAPAEAGPPLRVVLLGRGAVGAAVLPGLLARPGSFQVVAVAVREPARHRDLPEELVLADALRAAELDCDVVVELLGGVEPAVTCLARALAAGRDVVTANKPVMARCGRRLLRSARAGGARIRYSGAVGGAVPVLEAARALRGSLRRVDGVLNGTCNFVLEGMAAGASLAESLEEARRRGFAEADPGQDLNGSDVACKLALIARAGFGGAARRVTIRRRGIAGLCPEDVAAARAAGLCVRLVGSVWLEDGGVRGVVAPRLLPSSHPLAQAGEEWNTVILRREGGDPVVLRGRGAGGVPTAVAVMADLMDLWRSRRGVRR